MAGRVVSGGQMLQFRLLGPLEVWRNDRPVRLGGERQRALLALFLLHANELVTTERLVDQLFGGDMSDGTTNALHVAVSRLRRLLNEGHDDGVLITRPGGYVLRVESGQLDVALFERLCEEGQRTLAAGDPLAAAVALREALALFRGPALADLSLLEFVQPEVRRLEEMRLGALMERLDADLALGRHPELVAELESLIDAHPFQERLRGLLMLALYRSGRQADALDVYRQTRELLRDELGLEPSRALQQLERSILQQDESLEPAGRETSVARAAVTVCPFKGLAFFDRADVDYFCGRERLVADLVARLAATSLVGLVGPSGMGKSSVLRAGVLPALQRGVLPGSEQWRQFLVRPGAHPRAELARALESDGLDATLRRMDAGERAVLAVDQLEELFTVCHDERERAAFLDELVAAATDHARRALVIVSLRADFYGRCALYARFGELLSGAHVLVGPMDREELARAIEVPAGRAGIEIERPLVEALVADVADEPGGLPLLSTTLLELWSTRDGETLRFASYRTSGGVRGAVARLAELAYGRLDESDQSVARSILLRLASGSGETLTRRRIPPEDLGAEQNEAVRRVLGVLTASRLVTTSDGAVEVAHEALFVEWPRLRSWLEEDAQGRRLQEHLVESAREWSGAGRDASELYRGARLASALDWTSGHELELSPLEREFLDESRSASEWEAERQRRENRRLRGLLAGAAVLIVLALLAGALAWRAREQARDAETAAVAQRLGAQALGGRQLDLSLLLARQGVALDDSPATQGNLEAALAHSPAAIKVFHPLRGRLLAVEASRDGHWLLVTNNAQQLALVDRSTRRTLRVLDGDAGSFADDGRIMVRQGGDVSFIDPRTGAVSRLGLHLDAGTQAFSVGSDLTYAASSPVSGRPRNEVTVWDLRQRQRVFHRVSAHRGLQVADVEVGSGRVFVFESDKGLRAGVGLLGRVTVEVWSLDHWRRRLNITLSEAIGHGVAPWAIDRLGRRAAFGEADGSVTVADLVTGSVRKLRGRHGGGVIGVGFSPNGRTIVSTGDDNQVLVWDVASGRLRETLTGHAGRVFGPAFSPSGNSLYTVGLEGEAIAWDLGGARRFGQHFRAGSGNLDPTSVLDAEVARFALSPDGGRVATTQANGRTAVVDRLTGLRLFETPPAGGGRVLDVAWNPDGQTFATAGELGDVTSWHAADGSRAITYQGLLGQTAHALAFSPAGTLLAAASEGEGVYLWNARTGKPVGTPLRTGAPAYDLAFSPDGKLLAAASLGYGVAYVWRLPSQRLAFIVTIDDDLNRGDAVAFSPDSKLLATGGASGLVKFWDTQTGKQLGGPLLASAGYLLSLAFDPTGRLLVTSGTDGTTRLWDVRSRAPVGSPLPVLDNISAEAAFTASGDNLVTVYANGRAFTYDLRPSSWEKRACAVAGRRLTRQEWAQYLPGRPYRLVCS